VQYRRLGASDLTISEISLGSWLTYGVGVETGTSRACLDRAFELGINFVDTANVYGRGAAEEFLGDALAERERSSYVLATKLYFPMSDADRGLSAAQVRKQIDASLERLRTDYVDLYQCHRYDLETPLEETMHALTEVVREGKARYLGFSEWTPEQIRAAQEIPGVERFVSRQPQYSILSRKGRDGSRRALNRDRDLADRLVTARPGRVEWEVPPGKTRFPRTRVLHPTRWAGR